MVPRTWGRRLLVAVALVGCLVAVSAQAAPLRADAGGWLGWLATWWEALWSTEGAGAPPELPGPSSLPDKTGSMIDPDGQPTAGPVPPDHGDTGPGIDPDG